MAIQNHVLKHSRLASFGRSLTLAFVLLSVVLLSIIGCSSTSTPSNVSNICRVFDDKRGWYRSASNAEARWGISIPVMMAVIYKESSFIATARPPRNKILGFIPGKRPSTSYGYSQAKEETWMDYVKATKNRTASRTNFADSIDFVGWYLKRGVDHAGLSPTNASDLYLTYHLGLEGYKSGSWRDNEWVHRIAKTVQEQAALYQRQLPNCTVTRRS